MALTPTTLKDALEQVEFPADPTMAVKTWFDVWWKYASGSSHLNVGAAQGLAQGPFIGVLAPALAAPSPVPATFFQALEGAMRAAWAAIGTPAGLLQDPPVPGMFQRLALIPAPAPFMPMALPVVGIGIGSQSKSPPRAFLATQIHLWTVTHMVVNLIYTPTPAGITPIPGPPLPLL